MKTVNPTDTAVQNFLSGASITFDVKLIGETKREDWVCDQWAVTFKSTKNNKSFTEMFYTGTGHREIKRGFAYCSRSGARLVNGHWQVAIAKAPSAASVLHSLLMDATANDESFNNWASDFGYDVDSIKAFTLYQQCCKIAITLATVFTREQQSELRDLLQEY